MKESRERADEYILSFDLASELDIALAEDMEPYDWNEDFTEMVFESKKRGAHAKKLRQGEPDCQSLLSLPPNHRPVA